MDITTFQAAIQAHPHASRFVIQGSQVIESPGGEMSGVGVADETNTRAQAENRTFAASFLAALNLKYSADVVNTALVKVGFFSKMQEGSPFSASVIEQVFKELPVSTAPSSSTLRNLAAALGTVGAVAAVTKYFRASAPAAASLHFVAAPAGSASGAAAVGAAHATAAGVAGGSTLSSVVGTAVAAHPAAAVVIPIVALAAGSGRIAQLCTMIREEAMVIGGGVVGSVITAHPSASALLQGAVAGVVAHPVLVPVAVVGGGAMMVLNKDMRSTGATVVGGGAAGAYFAAHPAAGIAFVSKASEVIIQTCSAVGVAVHDVAQASSSALATNTASHSSAVGVSMVPYSSSTVSTITAHSGAAVGGHATMAAAGATALKVAAVAAATIAAHPIVLAGAVATGFYMLAQTSANSTEVTADSVNVAAERTMTRSELKYELERTEAEFKRLNELSPDERKKYEGSSYREALRDARNRRTDARYALDAASMTVEEDEFLNT